MEQDLILDFKQELYNNINNSKLPISVTYYLIKELYENIEKTYNEYERKYIMSKELQKEETHTVEVPLDDISKQEE